MATTRLRKAFHYPSSRSSSEDNSPIELDEEHQENLILSLQRRDEAQNSFYRQIFLAIPVTGALFFAYALVTASSARQRMVAVLGLSSLSATGYILWFVPVEKKREREEVRPDWQRVRRRAVELERGPVEKYLVYLNGALAGLLLIAAGLSWRRGGEDEGEIWREALPALMLGMTLFVRQQLAPLDFEELQKARYEYKGA